MLYVEAASSDSIYYALVLKTPLIIRFHPERDRGKLLQLDQNLSVPEMLQYFNLRRKMLLSVLQPLTPKQWERRIREENKARQETVYWRARGLALHDLDHLNDIEAKLNG